MKSVLVIDDEPAIRKALHRTLVSAGYPVQMANNGIEGLEALRTQTVDIVIVDIIMPKVNGVDTIRSIVREFPDVRIIAISGGGNFSPAEYQPHAIKTEAYLAAATVAGAHAVLTKPFRTQDVIHAIWTVTNQFSGDGGLI
jgi:CheY-like chemotaxis protein